MRLVVYGFICDMILSVSHEKAVILQAIKTQLV